MQPKIETELDFEPLSVLGPNKAQQLELVLSSISDENFRDFFESVDNMDVLNNKFPPQLFECLQNSLPDEVELKLILSVDRKDHLAHCDRFVKGLCTLEDYEKKLTFCAMLSVFEERLATVKNQIELTREFVERFMHSDKLYFVLALFLHIGNFLNYGNSKGSAKGFNIESLEKVRTHKNISSVFSVFFL